MDVPGSKSRFSAINGSSYERERVGRWRGGGDEKQGNSNTGNESSDDDDDHKEEEDESG